MKPDSGSLKKIKEIGKLLVRLITEKKGKRNNERKKKKKKELKDIQSQMRKEE